MARMFVHSGDRHLASATFNKSQEVELPLKDQQLKYEPALVRHANNNNNYYYYYYYYYYYCHYRRELVTGHCRLGFGTLGKKLMHCIIINYPMCAVYWMKSLLLKLRVAGTGSSSNQMMFLPMFGICMLLLLNPD